MPQADTLQPAKPARDWKSGDEPMTSRQRWFLTRLAEKAGVPVKDDLTKSQASKLIDELKAKAVPSPAGQSS